MIAPGAMSVLVLGLTLGDVDPVATASVSAVATTTVATATAAPDASLIPPRLVSSATIGYPDGQPPLDAPVIVQVKLRVDTAGAVTGVELVRSGGAAFDALVIRRTSKFRFAPATFAGAPVAVEVNYTQRFEPRRASPPPRASPGAPSGPPTVAVLQGRLREKGTRLPIRDAKITAQLRGHTYTTTSAADGRFALDLPAGEVTVEVAAYGYAPFRQQEKLQDGQRLNLVYLVQRTSYDPYEVIVIGKAERVEVSTTRLRDREIKQVPGTFGDPFRVIGALPGVTQPVSLLPFPIVRGSSPSSTGFLIDDVRVPLLFHFLGGPSVVHPEFIDEIDFMPGGFSAEYGGYTAGIVNGRTRSARSGEKRVDVDLNLFQSGGFVRYPIAPINTTVTVAGRVGYPGLLLSLLSDDVNLSYWDYQVRLDRGDRRSNLTLFAFGAQDTFTGSADDSDSRLAFLFHRIDLRYRHDRKAFGGEYKLALGYDASEIGPATLGSWRATPRAKWRVRLTETLTLRAGLDGQLSSTRIDPGMSRAGDTNVITDADSAPPNELYVFGAMTEALWRPLDGLVVRPGIRVDVYRGDGTTHVGVDPRLMARYQLTEQLTVKASAGLYHQPARSPIPAPGLDQLAFEAGLLEAVQTSVGAELEVGEGFSFDVTGYANFMDPILFDLAVNPDPSSFQSSFDDVVARSEDSDDGNRQLLTPRTGRAYGLELLLRRRSPTGVFGWISYTLSRSERLREGTWSAFDFDRTHILNLVTGVPLPRNWNVGLRLQVQSGRPFTTAFGRAGTRADTFVRFDLRIDKRAVWNEWLLDFYVDINNTLLSAEEVNAGSAFRYVLPTVGFRAIL